ncbi:hypothetical protein [Nocardia sp. NPDC006630]|uniref:hypothetical protein n=1 Tax=Nocardia sp. NPDC006630 TaxID=3157181 RepID=UPI0033B583B4
MSDRPQDAEGSDRLNFSPFSTGTICNASFSRNFSLLGGVYDVQRNGGAASFLRAPPAGVSTMQG